MLDGIAAVQIEAELWTLAHECGHFLWWKRGWDGDAVARMERCAYVAAIRHYETVEKVLAKEVRDTLTDAEYKRRRGASMRRELSTEEHHLILAEEQRAWDIGWELLRSYGAEALTDLIHYNARAIVAVNEYFVRLGLVGVDNQLPAGATIAGIHSISEVDVRSRAEMLRLGPPTLRVILDRGRYYAVEGTHRMAAARSLGYQPRFVVIADDNTPGDVPVKVDYGVQTIAQLRATFVVDNPCAPIFTF